MKTSIIYAAMIIAIALPLRAADTGQQFIRKVGTYQVATKMTLVVSRDPAGGLRYSFDRVYREPQASAQVQHKDKLTDPFLFYWDESSQVLWQATAKQITAHTPKGLTLYDNNPKALERAPDVFRTEVGRVFKPQ